MFSPKFYIDQFQNTKKLVTDQVYKNQPELKEAADRWVDAQTQFAQMLFDNTITVLKYSADQVSTITKSMVK